MTTTPQMDAPLRALLPGIDASFDFVDETRCRAVCVIGLNHPDYDGHFDERPVLPACSQFELLEAVARVAFNEALRFAGVPRCKFLGIISPGDTLTVDLVRAAEDATAFDFSILSEGGGPCARGKIRFEAPRRSAHVQ
ncbi:MAG: hypothetical protein IOD12_11545 [Silvanigrellales bacterium]|jgi:3-hydroxymyristoyl/3-hydroxydecanoyl-(acyl carrier protein) dehydratase|nr:hypothetical protein [Silvanigrellales bacterium]